MNLNVAFQGHPRPHLMVQAKFNGAVCLSLNDIQVTDRIWDMLTACLSLTHGLPFSCLKTVAIPPIAYMHYWTENLTLKSNTYKGGEGGILGVGIVCNH